MAAINTQYLVLSSEKSSRNTQLLNNRPTSLIRHVKTCQPPNIESIKHDTGSVGGSDFSREAASNPSQSRYLSRVPANCLLNESSTSSSCGNVVSKFVTR